MATPTLAHQGAIVNLYIALFNRAPDAAGFAFWTQALADGASIDVLARGFVQTPEAQAIYPVSQTAAQFVTTYYANVLGRPIDESGLAFWTGILESSGGVNSNFARALVVSKIVEVVNTPLPVKPDGLTDAAYALTFADRNTFKNKVDMSIFYAVEYKGEDLNLAKQVLAVIGPNTGTVDIGKGLLLPNTGGGGAPAPLPPPVVSPYDFTGTGGVDDFQGGIKDESFGFVIDKTTVANTTLQETDTIKGGGGANTLYITTRGDVQTTDFATKAAITNIETVVIKVEDTSARYTATPGVINLIADGGKGALVAGGLAAGTTVTIRGGATGPVFATHVPAVTTATVVLSNANNPALTVLGTGLTSTTVTSNDVANSLTSLSGSSSTVNLVANTALKINSLVTGNGGTVNVSGNAAVSLGVVNHSSLALIDATTNKGGLTAGLGSSNNAIVVKGSEGNDVISTGNAVLTGTVDAGAGTADRLIAAATVALATSTLRGKYTNFEILEVSSGVSVDLDGLAGITSVEIADGAGATSVTNLSVAQAAAVTILSANPVGAITIGLQNVAGTTDTVKAKVMTNVGTTATAVDLTGLTLVDIEKLELTGNGDVLTNNGLLTLTTSNATSLNSIIVKNAGGATVTVDAAHTANSLVIDASGSLGAVTLDASAYAGTGLTLRGGGNSSTMTGSAEADTLYAGKTVSTFTKMTGGAGADMFVFSTPDNGTAHGRLTAEITDFQTGIDKIKFNVVAPRSAAAYFEETAAAGRLAELFDTADTKLNGIIKIYVGQFGADTYVIADADGNGYTETIKLTGVSLNQIASTDFFMDPP